MWPGDCRTNDRSKSKEENFSRVSILRCQTKWCRVPSVTKAESCEFHGEKKWNSKNLSSSHTHDGHCGRACRAISYVKLCVPSKIRNPPRWNRIKLGLKPLSCRKKKYLQFTLINKQKRYLRNYTTTTPQFQASWSRLHESSFIN